MNRTAGRKQEASIACVAIILLISPVSAALATTPNVAPNTVGRAFQRSADAAVKLYGSGVGRARGYGTGFLISSDGKIVTTLSILTRSPNVRAVLGDGRQFDAKLLRADEYRQLALLKIDAKDLPFLQLVHSDGLAVGDTVIALGNWFKIAAGEEPISVNRGILSLKTNLAARRLAQDFEYGGPVLIIDAITSTPGAPGGPLLDIDGNCVGILGRIVWALNTNTRLNYAVPSEEVLAFLGGKPSARAPAASNSPRDRKAAPFVGIKISKLGYRHVSAYVQRVRRGSPAAEAGIRPDDLIVAIAGRRIPDADTYKAAVSQLTPGQVVPFTIKRKATLVTVEVRIGTKP